MNGRQDVERVVIDWLNADAAATGSGRVLAATLARVAATGQERYVTQRIFGDRYGRSRELRWALLAGLLTIALLGAAALVGGLPRPRTVAAIGAFAPGPSLLHGRGWHTATRLPDGRVFVVGGNSSADLPNVESASGEVWVPVAGTPGSDAGRFTPAGSPIVMRSFHTATLLSDGTVLIIGGSETTGTAEVWDPQRASFVAAGDVASPRSDHTATLLPDGRVLVVGGWQGDGPLATAELWDPVARSFRPTGSLHEARYFHTATLLRDGRVLVVGGDGGHGALASAEIWDPRTGTFSTARSLSEPRADHTATALNDGTALIAGGSRAAGALGVSLKTVELWDPTTESFRSTGALLEARASHTDTLLTDGRVLIVGGRNDRSLATAEIYDPTSNTFGTTGSLAEPRSTHTATLLTDGRVLVVGDARRSGSLASSEIWDPAGTPAPAHSATPVPSPTPTPTPTPARLSGVVP